MRWSMLPVSIVIHAAALVFMLVVPFVAEIELPTPWPLGLKSYVVASAAPPPVPVQRPQTASPPMSQGPPLQAPDRIEHTLEETSIGPSIEGALPDSGPVGSGVPSGLNVGAEAPALPPPLPTQRPQVVRVGGDIREPRRIVNVAPVYPELARQVKVEGLVIIEAVIDERGVVSDARVLRSQPLLDAAALDAVKQWRYTPTLLNGVPVKVLMTITFNFTLSHRAP